MRNIFKAAAIALLLACGTLCNGLYAQTAGRAITLEDIWLKGTFRIASVPGFNAMKDGVRYTQLDSGGRINAYDLRSGAKLSTIFSGAIPAPAGQVPVEEYFFSGDETQLLLRGAGRPLYRRSAFYRTAVYDVAAKTFLEVDTGAVLHAQLSPDGSKVAFVRDNNLYYRDLTAGRTVAVTTDGKWNHIINGNCDWVYEEEFEFTQAYQWSPDSRYLAYYRFDESGVPEYSFPKYSGLYPENYSYKYPKAGEKNSVVTIHFFDLSTGKKTLAQTTPDGNTDHYIPRIAWTTDATKLCILKLNRLQNRLDFLLTDRSTGAASSILTETDSAFVEINDNFQFLPDGRSMIYTSERDGFNRLYHYDWTRKKYTALSGRFYDVENIVSYDDQAKQVFFSAAVLPISRSLQVAGINGKGLRTITPAGTGTHAITPAGELFLDRHSEINRPPTYKLIDKKGVSVRTVVDNQPLKDKMDAYGITRPRMLSFPTPMEIPGQQQKLVNWCIFPPDFDSSRRYPVLMYQYSGPGSQESGDRFPVRDFFWHQMLAQKGYMVVCVDGRGTGARGRDFKKSTYLQLGKLESDDQIAAARYLRTLPFVDSSRIGIWGWSYGGFMSSTCLFKAPDVFKMAIAVAPVTNWRYYDNIYTERYMRTPQVNAKGYDDNSPVNMVQNLRGKFLLVHGTADDNVHFQNSVELSDALIKAGKQFDFAMYPDKAHGISGAQTRYQLYGKMTDFVLQNL
jgi:dipeptidyl-peptidase-4